MKIREKNFALLKAMNEKGYNSKTLCLATQIHTNTMSLILNKRRVPSKTTARLIAKELKVTIKSLFPEVYDKGEFKVSK
jgi:transcriptional regulator with XRE-family HTH domain